MEERRAGDGKGESGEGLLGGAGEDIFCFHNRTVNWIFLTALPGFISRRRATSNAASMPQRRLTAHPWAVIP